MNRPTRTEWAVAVMRDGQRHPIWLTSSEHTARAALRDDFPDLPTAHIARRVTSAHGESPWEAAL